MCWESITQEYWTTEITKQRDESQKEWELLLFTREELNLPMKKIYKGGAYL